ncbi:MAG: hypothetical protein LUF34_12140, partial [Lachnospiraceae bacterium]|nr:hypothetical protein [Lachnospiraceae bacterium]
MREYERKYGAGGLIGGVDEAGRGPLAGPVVAACVILQPDCDIFYLDDSKKVTERRRELLYSWCCGGAVCYGGGWVGPGGGEVGWIGRAPSR